jgi:hypothetical protein
VKRTIVTLAVTLILGPSLAGNAQAASIRECGSRPAANGYQDLVNITSRNVLCSQARHIAFVIYREVGPNSGGRGRCLRNCVVHWMGWKITVRYFSAYPLPPLPDVRSTASGGRVVRFQARGY